MKYLFVLVIMLCCTAGASAQYTRYIIQLANKKNTPYSLSAPSAYLSAKALERRNKQHISIDSTDLPVTPAYLDSIRSVPNVTILNTSKWLNQVLIRTTDVNALTTINAFTFVKVATAIAPRIAGRVANEAHTHKFDDTIVTGLPVSNPAARIMGNDLYSYGSMYDQIHIHQGEYLHNLGFTGRGITIAVLDGGFNAYKTNPAFDSVRLQNRFLGERDFVTNDGSVNEDNVHGAQCLSTMAANRPGTMTGTAPHASFWLLRTEDTNSEYPVEEQNWAAGAEFADSVGVEIISTSLGYQDFDNPAFDHTYAQRDGNTTIITRAADFAAHKGILVAVSAGNSGTQTTDGRFVLCPADADSVLTIGAIGTDSVIAPFSSWGPNGAGKVKPNVVSVGNPAVVASQAGTPAYSGGTSFSNPNLCGLVACLWQAFPEFNNMQIIDAVQRSSHKYNNPDTRFGYGIPNFRKAYELLQQQRNSNNNYENVLGDKWIKAFPVPFSATVSVVLKAQVTGRASLQFTDVAGHILDTRILDLVTGQVYVTEFPRVAALAKGAYYIRYQDGTNKQTLQVMKR